MTWSYEALVFINLGMAEVQEKFRYVYSCDVDAFLQIKMYVYLFLCYLFYLSSLILKWSLCIQIWHLLFWNKYYGEKVPKPIQMIMSSHTKCTLLQ